MKRIMALVLSALALDALGGCVSIPSAPNVFNWSPSLQQFKAAALLKPGVATIADVEAIYAVKCEPMASASATAPCTVFVNNGPIPQTLLMYSFITDWSPSCWSDPVGCETLSQSTSRQISYVFDAQGVLKSVSFDSSCTAYVGQYKFDNGCLDHD